MRIIAGEFRGRPILPPDTDATRPITDRAKQSLFDILAPYLPDAAVFDVFAGTGSMGLESLSRGAASAVFFERDRSAVARLRRNIDMLGVGCRTTVVDGDLFQWFARPRPTPAAPPFRADCVFLDPPYRLLRDTPNDLRHLAGRLATDYLAENGFVVFRHDIADALDLPPFTAASRREYGGMAIDFLRRPPATPKG